MAKYEDSRPFAELKCDAEDFKSRFDEDVSLCLKTLEAKICELMLDPDTLETQESTKRYHTQIEFSKAKYDIFMSLKSLINEKEEEWLESISEMKKRFLENVEIFLAGTKLEVRLPSEEMLSRSGSRRGTPTSSTRTPKGKAESAKSPLYPLITNFTKNIASLSIPLLNKSVDEKTANDVEMDHDSLKDTENVRTGRNQMESVRAKSKQSSPRRKTPSPVKGNSTSTSSSSSNSSISSNNNNSEEINSSVHTSTPVRIGKRGREKTALNQSSLISDEKIPTPVASGRKTRGKAVSNPSDSDVHIPTPVVTSGRKPRGKAASIPSDLVSDEQIPSPVVTSGRKTRGRAVSNTSVNSTPSKSKQQPTRKQGRLQEVSTILDESPVNQQKEDSVRTPKRVTFSDKNTTVTVPKDVDVDEFDDLEVFLPETTPNKYTPRRTTVFIEAQYKDLSGLELFPERSSRSSKRKTIASVSELSVPSPAKVMKTSSPESASKSDAYTVWMPLQSIDGKTPAKAAVYELKVGRAKKPAFIGFCDNLRHQLTLHRLGQSSGHKHLDKFLERNLDDVHVRYEVMPSPSEAKLEVKNRINEFVNLYKTTPAYN